MIDGVLALRRRRSRAGVFWAVLVAAACPAVGGVAPAAAAAVRPGDGVGPVSPHVKRGVASSRYLGSQPAVLSKVRPAWAYDWSATPPRSRSRIQWVPMVWGGGSVTSSVIAALTTVRRSGRAADLLGFNEPDSASQSNMSPGQAAALWPQLERTGLRLGSPAPAVPTDGWLARFMSLARARHLRVDFIALHYYQDFTNPDAVGALRRQLVAIHDTYHRPIWITEIGAIDIRSWQEPMLRVPTQARADGYMRHVFAMLDALPFVSRYAWFTDDCWSDRACRSSSLFTASGQLTAPGSIFRTAP